jgi:DNA-3-methyladenine glycosylase II
MAIDALDDLSLAAAARILAERDPDLAGVVQRYGVPPMWSRPPGFATLIRIILEQQVSLASAMAAFTRLRVRLGAQADEELSPQAFLTLDDAELKTIGFSRQKTRYTRLLAETLLSGRLDLAKLELLDDAAAHACLVDLKGIGHWSADIYLLMALRRPDIWPRSDLALISAVARLKKLPALPSPQEFDRIGEAWRPYRSVAARLAWFEYLGGKP